MKRIVLTTTDFRHYAHPYPTNGLLEKAIELGYEVFVVSTRSKTTEVDAWWLALVPADHIFLADPKPGTCESWDIDSGRKRLVSALGLQWPEGIRPNIAYWLPSQGIDNASALRK
jgi:hypothetical protein